MTILIAGGGIGGLTTALMLHQRGIDCEVFERSSEIRELGVGINTLPHAIRELADLGLLDALDRVAIRTYELIYQNRHGQEIWRDLRGLDDGYDYPQFSINRGKLQGVLHEAVLERLGAEKIHTAHELKDVSQDENAVTAHFEDRRTGTMVDINGDALIAADGIHSVMRAKYYPDQGPPEWTGGLMWRGATPWPPFLTGRSMVIAGGLDAKLVLYPLSVIPGDEDLVELNWAIVGQIGDGSKPPPRREDWSRHGRLEDVLPFVEDRFSLDVLNPTELIKSTEVFYEYPMCDRTPVEQWSFGRVTLLGDAAHPMYPVGSNGASQAILDARALANHLVAEDNTEAALKAYEDERLEVTAQIVYTNRKGGPEGVIDLVDSRAPDGFEKLSDVASQEELEGIIRGYSKLAGFSRSDVNRPIDKS